MRAAYVRTTHTNSIPRLPAKNAQKVRKNLAKNAQRFQASSYPQFSKNTKSRLRCPSTASGNSVFVSTVIASRARY